MSHVNIVIPMAGYGSRFSAAGYKDPKPLIDVFGKPMIQAVIDNLRPQQPHRFIFICQRAHYAEYGLEKLFQESLGSNWGCVQLDGVTEGAACTVLTASHLIDDDADLIIANSDQIVDCDMSDFIGFARETQCDGLVMTFPADDTKWSYISISPDGFGLEVAEKKVISPHATVGIYHFASGKSFIDAANRMIAKDIRVNNEFYVAPVYNELIAEGKNIRIWEIAESAMHGIGTPTDLQGYFALKGGYQSRSAPAA